MGLAAQTRLSPDDGFRHEALCYAGQDDFLTRTTAFVREGLDIGESVLVLVRQPKIDLMRAALGRSDADRVLFGDIGDIGRNPSRIIPVWREFVESFTHGGGRVRGIGEPVWAERRPEELEESQRHESLINLALAGAPVWILCPYDLDALDPSAIDEALRSHPIVSGNGPDPVSQTYRSLEDVGRPYASPLRDPPPGAERLAVTVDSLTTVRRLAMTRGWDFGLPPDRVQDLVLAVNEVATNSLVHGRGATSLQTWAEGDELIFEIVDAGSITDPLVGRSKPEAGQATGYGMWMANQVCDLVQVRSFDKGSAVRLRMSRR
jgi:anti-sigma regulatory factor (Ser/Thr protein kinase)